MVEPAIIDVVQHYLTVVRQSGIQAHKAILFGSYARNEAHEDSDIDILVIAPEFDGAYDSSKWRLLWALRTKQTVALSRYPLANASGAKIIRKLFWKWRDAKDWKSPYL